MAFQRHVAQFSRVEEEGLSTQGDSSPPARLFSTANGEGESLGLLLVKPRHGFFLWKIHLAMEQIYLPMGGHRPGDFMVACKWESQRQILILILMDVIRFDRTVRAGELVGRGCFFPACTVPQPTLARPRWV